MTAQPPLYGRTQDETPWRGDGGGSNPAGLPETIHILTFVGGAYLCAACSFATRDPGEAAGHLAASQWLSEPRKSRP